MKIVMKSFLFAAAASAPACAVAQANECRPHGHDICAYAQQVATALNKNGAGISREFDSPGVRAERGKITIPYVFKGGKDEFSAFLSSVGNTEDRYSAELRAISKQAGCMQPVRRLIVNGGSARFIFRLNDGGVIAEERVTSCQ